MGNNILLLILLRPVGRPCTEQCVLCYYRSTGHLYGKFSLIDLAGELWVYITCRQKSPMITLTPVRSSATENFLALKFFKTDKDINIHPKEQFHCTIIIYMYCIVGISSGKNFVASDKIVSR